MGGRFSVGLARRVKNRPARRAIRSAERVAPTDAFRANQGLKILQIQHIQNAVAEELDERIAQVADLFALRSVTGSVVFPDGLRVEYSSIPSSARSPATETPRSLDEIERDQRRAHYNDQLGRPVSDRELDALP